MTVCKVCNKIISKNNNGCHEDKMIMTNDGLIHIPIVVESDDCSNLGCFDCGAPIGTCHHSRCDQEKCPVCKKQLITCGHI